MLKNAKKVLFEVVHFIVQRNNKDCLSIIIYLCTSSSYTSFSMNKAQNISKLFEKHHQIFLKWIASDRYCYYSVSSVLLYIVKKIAGQDVRYAYIIKQQSLSSCYWLFNSRSVIWSYRDGHIIIAKWKTEGRVR